MLPNESTVGLQAEVERLENQCSLLAAEQEKEYHRANRAEACLSEIRAAADEWEKEGPCEEWAGLNDAAQQLRKILEKYDGLE